MDYAKRYAEQLPAPSSMFTACVRAIKSGENALRDGDPAALKELGITSASFLFGISPTIKTVFFRAAENLYPGELGKLTPLNSKGLLALFQPSEITALLAVTYLYRHLKRRMPGEAFGKLMRKMVTHIEIGAIVGRTVKYIGTGNGMLLGGVRYLALALFLLADEKKFNECRRKAERLDQLFCPQAEKELFGCTSLEVASQIVRTFGFGLVTSSAFVFAHSDETPVGFSEQMTEELLCWRVAIMLTESFHHTGNGPVVSEDSVLYLPPDEAAILQKQCWSIIRDGSTFTWVTANRKELPEEVCTALDIPAKADHKAGIEELEEGEDLAS
jgi:hypothetical protein